MSQKIACVVVVLLLLMLWPVASAGAEEAEVKLIVLMEEFAVYPDKAEEYEGLIKKLVEVSTAHDFPYRFDSYRLDDMRYLAVWWIDGTAGIDNLYGAWDLMAGQWGEEESAKWMQDVYATMSYWKTSVWVPRPDLSYLPKNDTDEFKYVVWGVLPIKPGHEKEMEAIFKEYIEVFAKFELPYSWNTAEAFVGVENPTIGFLEWSSTSGSFWMREDKMMKNEELIKATTELGKKMSPHIRGFDRVTGYFLDELSYRPKEEE